MINLMNDYNVIAHNKILKDLQKYQTELHVGYGMDDVCKEAKELILNLTIDTSICSIMDYFEIFLSRMNLCKKACKFFDLTFKLIINNQSFI